MGMARDLAGSSVFSKDLFDLADEILDFDVKSVCWEGNELIGRTEYAQPALLAAELACLAALFENGVKPSMAAGHSLGEYGALVAAGALDAASALKLVSVRGSISGGVAREAGGGMAAVVGLDRAALDTMLDSARAEGIVDISNYNAPGQVVISGQNAALEKAVSWARSLGAKRVVPLSVSGPFHSPLMLPAAERFAREVEATELGAPSIPVISNFDALPCSDPGVIKRNLVRQLHHPVRWEDSIATMSALGAEVFVEVGPGRVLQGLVRRCAPTTAVLGVEDPDTLARALEFLDKSLPARVEGGD